MESRIWKVTTEEMGTLEPFKSEYDMEAFLMNHPEIIGCWDPEIESAPRLLRQQLSTSKKTGERGRIDLIGLVLDGEDYLLKIFELKKGEITEGSVEQLISYLKGWSEEKSAQEQIRYWIKELDKPASDYKKLEKNLANPRGVIIGASFSPEAITLASQNKIEGIRLARFVSTTSKEYYIVIEDQIGEIVSSAKRILLSWSDLEKANLIEYQDRFYLEANDKKIWARPDKETFDRTGKRFILEEESRNLLLRTQDKIRANAHNEYDKKTVEQALSDLKASKAISFTGVACLAFLAFERKRKSYFTPAIHWKLERTNETIYQLDSRAKNSKK